MCYPIHAPSADPANPLRRRLAQYSISSEQPAAAIAEPPTADDAHTRPPWRRPPTLTSHFVDKTPEGRYRAYFRDPAGKQRSKTFKVKKDATAFLSEMETSKSRGTYVSPYAGRMLFGEHARRWMQTRNTEAMTTARDRSIIATHVLPRWGDMPLGRIDDIGLQEWVTELGRHRSRATVSKALQLTAAVLRSAVRNRLIPFNPAEGAGPWRAAARYRRADDQSSRSADPATPGTPRAAPRRRGSRSWCRTAVG